MWERCRERVQREKEGQHGRMAVVDLPVAEHESLGRGAAEVCCGPSGGAVSER